MSTLKVSNIQNADAAAVGIILNADGSVEIPSLDVSLEGLSDLDITNPQSGEILGYDGSDWVNADPAPIVDPLADARIAAASIDDLSDVDAGAPQDGDLLSFNDYTSTWEAGPISIGIGDLQDVEIDGPQEGQALVYDADSGEWINLTFPGVNLRVANVVLEVGPTGDFETLNEALEELSTLRTTYSNSPIKGLIRLQQDFEMVEQVIVDGKDFSWVTILSDAGTDPVTVDTFSQGSLIPGFARPEISQVTIGAFAGGQGGNLDNHFIEIDDADGTDYYFWFQVLRFASVTIQGRVKVDDDAPGTSALQVVTQAGAEAGDPLSAAIVGNDIEVTLGTRAADTQASTTLFSDDGGVIAVSATASGAFDGAAGNLEVEVIDSGSSGINASVIGTTLTIDLGGTASVSTALVSASIDSISGLDASVSTAGNFTIADDLGPQTPLSGGFDAGTLDPAQNTGTLVAAAIDGLAGVSASAVGAGSITVEDTFPLVGGEGQSTDPTPGGATSVEVTIDVSFDAEQAAAELRSEVDAQATLSADPYILGRVVRIINDVDGTADDVLTQGGFLTPSTIQQGQDDGFQTLVTAPGHTFDDGDLITIRGHVGTIQEVDYNGRWTVVESDQGAGTFELDFVADPRAIFQADRAGVPGTAEAVLPANVPVSRAALTINFEFFYFPAFGVARGVLPTIGCVFEMDETGPNPYISYKDGFCATDQGRINFLPFSGFVNAGGSNIYATRSSIINANDAIADGAKLNGIWAYSTSIINARRASATNCGSEGIPENVGGGFDATGLPVGSGVLAERGSLINAEGVDATGSAASAFLAQYGGQINVGADPGLAQGSGTSILGKEFEARGGIVFGVNGDSQGWIAPPIIAMERVVEDDDATLELGDRGMVVAMDSSDPHEVTVPLNSTVAFPVGTVVNIYRAGTGAVDIVGEVGVTIRNTGEISEQFGEVSLRKRATNEWVLVGEVDEP